MTAGAQRIVWISGASTGIGRALAEEFALHGDRVLATARSLTRLEELRQRILAGGWSCEVEACDVQDAASVRRTGDELLRRCGRIDVLINNAGVTYFKDFESTTLEEFDHVMNTNLRGVFLTTKSVLPSMVRERRGMVINILSFAAKAVYRKSSAYAASKAGAEALMNGLRAEVRDRGVRVVNVFPGAVRTSIWHPKHQERYGDRMLAPRDVARLVYDVSAQPESVLVEELVIRPQGGDLQV